VFGTDPKTGFARNPFDNVGVQYGLKALNDGRITFDQFIDINTRIGGHDSDGKTVAQRTVGDPEAIRRAYETGRMNAFTGGVGSIPVIDIRTYNDGDPLGRGDPMSMCTTAITASWCGRGSSNITARPPIT